MTINSKNLIKYSNKVSKNRRMVRTNGWISNVCNEPMGMCHLIVTWRPITVSDSLTQIVTDGISNFWCLNSSSYQVVAIRKDFCFLQFTYIDLILLCLRDVFEFHYVNLLELCWECIHSFDFFITRILNNLKYLISDFAVDELCNIYFNFINY